MAFLASSTCPECGKEFYPAPLHTYVVDGKKYCRYSCYNAVLKRKEQKRQRNYLKSKAVFYGSKL